MEGSPVSEGGASLMSLAFCHRRVVAWQETGHSNCHHLGLGQLEAARYPTEAWWCLATHAAQTERAPPNSSWDSPGRGRRGGQLGAVFILQAGSQVMMLVRNPRQQASKSVSKWVGEGAGQSSHATSRDAYRSGLGVESGPLRVGWNRYKNEYWHL